MKAIAVSQRVDRIHVRNEQRDALDARLSLWLVSAGLLPYPVPNALVTTGKLNTWLERIKPAGVILSGGNDVGNEPHRDASENALLEHALKFHLPVLGICRGMQMIGAWSGVGLKPVENHAGARHIVTGIVSGFVNSYHHYSLADCPPQFDVLARSTDGEIEAIRHRKLLWEGWMWHPERETEFDARDTSRLRALFS